MKLTQLAKLTIIPALAGNLALAAPPASSGTVYPDGRPSATLRLDAKDQGVVLKHGDGPNQCDILGAREALIFEENGVYHLFHDGAGPKGWLACLATSKDLKAWNAKNKAVVLDGKNCTWSKKCLGMPSVVKVGKRLAIFYDGPGGDSTDHMRRDVGLAWLELPLTPPAESMKYITVASCFINNNQKEK